jgi:MFS family permease
VTKGQTFRALRERNARLFFGGLLVSTIGTWAQATATSLLVARLAPASSRGTALGLAVMLQFLPMLLLGAWAGAFADQRNRRRLTIITQSLLAAQAIAIAVLDFSGRATLPVVYLLALFLGIAGAIDNPARRGLVVELVDPEDIGNAVSLNTAVMTGSRIFGPALAAWLVTSFGTAWCFLVNAVSFVAVLGALVAMDPAKLRSSPPAPRGGTPVRDGLRFVWREPRLRLTFGLLTVVSTFSFNYPVALPLLAESQWGSEAAFGWVLAVTSVGSVTGSLLTASRREVGLRWMLGSVAALGAFSIGLAFSPNLGVAFAFAVPMGMGAAAFIASSNIIAQTMAPPTMRSRLLALSAVAFLGSTPIGGPITGWIADHVSPQWSLAYGGVAALLIALVGAALARRARARAGVAEHVGVVEAPATVVP